MSTVGLLLPLLLIPGHVWGASVCEILDHRLDLNGKQVEVTGHLGGGTYTGFFVYEKEAPCHYRWIFSWPSMLGLWSKGANIVKLPSELEKYTGKPVDIVVKGRLITRSDFYVIRLPWRPKRFPFGRYYYGGVAAAIEISDMKISSK